MVIKFLKHRLKTNYAFADGSARFLKDGQAVAPVNLWAVTEAWRNAPAKPAGP